MGSFSTVACKAGETVKVVIVGAESYQHFASAPNANEALPDANDTVVTVWNQGTATVTISHEGVNKASYGRVVDFERVIMFNNNYYAKLVDSNAIGTAYVVGGTPCG